MSDGWRLLIASAAAADLREIALYIEQDNPARAATFIAELRVKCASILIMPRSLPARDDLTPGLRMAVHGRYLIFFRALTNEGIVRVERVVHSARLLPGLF